MRAQKMAEKRKGKWMKQLKTKTGKIIIFIITAAAMMSLFLSIAATWLAWISGFYQNMKPLNDPIIQWELRRNGKDVVLDYIHDPTVGIRISNFEKPDNFRYKLMFENKLVLEKNTDDFDQTSAGASDAENYSMEASGTGKYSMENHNMDNSRKSAVQSDPGKYGTEKNDAGYTIDTFYYIVTTEKDVVSCLDKTDFNIQKNTCLAENIYKQTYVIQAYFENGVPNSPEYLLLNLLYTHREMIVYIGIAAGLVGLLGMILLIATAGRKPGSKELYPEIAKKLPLDGVFAGLAVVCTLIGLVIYFGIGVSLPVGERGLYAVEIYIGLGGFLIVSLIQFGLVIGVIQIKNKSLIKNLFMIRLVKFLWKSFIRIQKSLVGSIEKCMWNFSIIKKEVLIFAAVSFVKLVVLSTGKMSVILFAWFVGSILELILLFWIGRQLQSLRAAGHALAMGSRDFSLEPEKLYGAMKEHGQDLLHISDGIHRAVEEQLRSERMKTELITNVSHDLKTPLTSLINYADLLGKEESDNPKIKEYSQVVLRQSDRLKRLIEDLVEASKAASGNLEVHLMECDARNFLTQSAGEYAQKLETAQLELVIHCTDEAVMIRADGRRMLRIFDNLMNNICKYAMSGTRVYLTLERIDDQAQISFKNISKNPLGDRPEELIQRFVRGDRSRNTEGNGLGLSIAKSLTELQGGNFTLDVDGDLFKVILRFPVH